MVWRTQYTFGSRTSLTSEQLTLPNPEVLMPILPLRIALRQLSAMAETVVDWVAVSVFLALKDVVALLTSIAMGTMTVIAIMVEVVVVNFLDSERKIRIDQATGARPSVLFTPIIEMVTRYSKAIGLTRQKIKLRRLSQNRRQQGRAETIRR